MLPKTWHLNVEPRLYGPTVHSFLPTLHHGRDVRFLEVTNFYDGPLSAWGRMIESGDLVHISLSDWADFWHNRPYYIYELTREEQTEASRRIMVHRAYYGNRWTVPYSQSGKRLPRHSQPSVPGTMTHEEFRLEVETWESLPPRPPSALMYMHPTPHKRRRSREYYLKYQK